jgi:histidinol-phosphate/aromatic aminotransferase/cobyric acid decarboxylase-like protein
MIITETELMAKFLQLKAESGSHSPSLASIKESMPELTIKVDACFLSNPYATELFLKYFKTELIETGEINRVLELYPSQNTEISKSVAEHLGIERKRIFIGNGATEIIQAIIHTFIKGKIVVNIPTFSPYYEFVQSDKNVVFYQLQKNENYQLRPEAYIKFVTETKPDAIIIINPNNPDGGYLQLKDLMAIIKELSWVPNIIVDESFIHFAFEDSDLELPSIVPHINGMENVTIIKSMSKDFGIAGIRCGYAIMSEDKVDSLLKNGFLWNSNGLAEYFFRLYTRRDFLKEYEQVRKKYITESLFFINELNRITQIKAYPTKANFVLIEILSELTSLELTGKLLVEYGIYVRDCSDKIGLQGKFIRLASRNKNENDYIVKALKEIFK